MKGCYSTHRFSSQSWAFEKLGPYTLYYSDISLLEASWKIVKAVKMGEEEVSRIVEGVRWITYSTQPRS